MDEKEYLGLVWRVCVDSLKNVMHGNQSIGALNDCCRETQNRFEALGGTYGELEAYE